jgi:hypothetical protein
MATVTRFVVNRAGMNDLFRNPRQPVALFQSNLGKKIAANARRTAPVGHGEGPHLKDNISSKLVPSRKGGYDIQIVAGVPWAEFVVKGTKPHSIGASVEVEPGVWRYIGLSPKGKGKIHPGTKANPFMYKAAEQEGLKVRRLA